MARLTVADLRDEERFVKLDTLDHQNLGRFVTQYFWRRPTAAVALHHLFTLSVLAALVATGAQRRYSLDGWLGNLGAALLLFLLLVPVHEALHALAYRLLGARDLHWGISWQWLSVYVIADQYVAGRVEFFVVAVLPFLVLNGLLLLASVLFPGARLLLLMVLLLHQTGTSGDWALLNYFYLHPGEVYTYDDAPSHYTYFFQRRAGE